MEVGVCELLHTVMPDCRGVGESRIYSKHAKKSPFAGFVPQSGITGSTLRIVLRGQRLTVEFQLLRELYSLYKIFI